MGPQHLIQMVSDLWDSRACLVSGKQPTTRTRHFRKGERFMSSQRVEARVFSRLSLLCASSMPRGEYSTRGLRGRPFLPWSP